MSNSICPDCDGIDKPYEHGCHCVRTPEGRIAIGICCGRMVGEKTLAEEDAADQSWRTRPPRAPLIVEVPNLLSLVADRLPKPTCNMLDCPVCKAEKNE